MQCIAHIRNSDLPYKAVTLVNEQMISSSPFTFHRLMLRPAKDHFRGMFLPEHNKHIYVYSLHRYRLSLPKQHVNIDTVMDNINPCEIDAHQVQLSK